MCGIGIQEFEPIGSKYNRSARPFLGAGHVTSGSRPAPTNVQYNSPMKLYSNDSATDAVHSAQSAIHRYRSICTTDEIL